MENSRLKHTLVSKVVHIWQRVLDGAYVLAVMLTLHCLVLREHKMSVNSDCSLKTAQKKVKLTNLSIKRESELTSTLGLGKVKLSYISKA